MKVTKKICQNCWTIGFIQSTLDNVLNNKGGKIQWIKSPYKDRWFADPFILDVDDSYIFLLVEEFYDKIDRGRLAKLTIKKSDYTVIDSFPILELNTHLSFPFIKRDNNIIYIIPENYESGELVEYIYDIKTNKCVFNRVLCKLPLMDAILTNVFGEERLFSTKYPDHSTLYEYKYNQKLKTFEEVGYTPFNSEIARNAGDWFIKDGVVYRPAQDCNELYGKAIIIQRIEKKQFGRYIFYDCCRIESTNKKYSLGCHTFNTYKGVIAIDAKAKRYPFLYSIFSIIASCKKWIMSL